MVATVVPPIKQKKKRRRSSIFRNLFRRLRAPLSRRRRKKFMKKIETSLSEGSRPPPPPVRIRIVSHTHTHSLVSLNPLIKYEQVRVVPPRQTTIPIARLVRRSPSSSSPLHRDLVALASRLTEDQQIELARAEQERLNRELNISRNLDLTSYEDLVRLNESNVKVNVTSVELSQLPVFSFRSNSSSSHEKECTICTDPFQTGDTLRRLPCLHTFHRDCIDEWFQRSRKCPICMMRVEV